MSSLFVYHLSSPELPLKVLNHLEDITATLSPLGITLERWPVTVPVAAGSLPDQVLAACQEPLGQLARERNLTPQHVVSLDRMPLAAVDGSTGHLYAQPDVRWFVAGRGLVYARVDEHVYAVLCEKHDLLTLPAGTLQWFDAGENPYLIAVRLAASDQAATVQSGGDDLASRFPRLEY